MEFGDSGPNLSTSSAIHGPGANSRSGRNSLTEDEAAELRNMLESNGEDLQDSDILVAIDKDGPLEDPATSAADIWPGVRESLENLGRHPGVEYAVVSGWDVDTLRRRRASYLDDKFHLGGSMGTVVDLDGEKIQVNDVSKESIYKSFQQLYEDAADQGVKILPQGNFSNVVASVKFEAEGEERANLGQITDDPTTEEIYSKIKQVDPSASFFYQPKGRGDSDGRIVFENNDRNSRIVTDVLTQEFVFPGVRFERTEDDRIALHRDPEDREDYGLEEGYSLIENAARPEIETTENEDWGSDLVRKDIEAGKHQAIEEIGGYAFEDGYDFGFMVGDSVSDMDAAIKLDDIYFVAVEGSEAERAARQYEEWSEGEDYVTAKNAVPFFQSFSTLMDQNRENWNQEIYKGSTHGIVDR